MIVETLNSTYVFDMEAQTVQRTVHWGEPLRRDDEVLPVLDLLHPVVGQPLRMVIQIRADGVPTLRTTSEVIRVSE